MFLVIVGRPQGGVLGLGYCISLQFGSIWSGQIILISEIDTLRPEIASFPINK